MSPSSASSEHSFFATCPRNTEGLLLDELRGLGLPGPRETRGGISFQGPLEGAYRACLWSRVAARVLLRLFSVTITDVDDLYEAVRLLPWEDHVDETGTIAVEATSTIRQGPLAQVNTHFVEQRVKDAVVDRFRERTGVRPQVDLSRPHIRINVHLAPSETVVSLDLSGDGLHRRGYRLEGGEAPLKENLAAALLLRSHWPRMAAEGAPLLDPMCGSGTLVIEGALMAGDVAPGLGRDYFGFLDWKGFDRRLWQQLLEEAAARRAEGLARLPAFFGYDSDRRAVGTAQANARRAGLAGRLLLERRALDSLRSPSKAPRPGLVITNPPYGKRLGEISELVPLYEALGEQLKASFSGWEAAVFTGNPQLSAHLGMRAHRVNTFYNGPIECRLLQFRVGAAFEGRRERATGPFAAQADRGERAAGPGTAEAGGGDGSAQEADRSAGRPGSARETDRSPGRPGGGRTGSRATAGGRTGHPDVEEAAAPTLSPGAAMFANRLAKNYRHLRRWAAREGVHCYRLYDADLPEYAAAVDLYQDWLHIQEYAPPPSVDPVQARRRLKEMAAAAPAVLGLPPEHAVLKVRRRQRGTAQYERQGEHGRELEVQEGGLRLLVNLTDYLDTGLFLDHRPTRALIRSLAEGRRFLNLFSYTGTATVFAAAGGAVKTTSVDLSSPYLAWARRNLELNGLLTHQHSFVKADVLTWLEDAHSESYDLIFLDAPTFSNSKSMADTLDIQRDHPRLIRASMDLLAHGGTLVFSSNFRRFRMEPQLLEEFAVTDITKQTIPPDFARNPRIHVCFRIDRLQSDRRRRR